MNKQFDLGFDLSDCDPVMSLDDYQDLLHEWQSKNFGSQPISNAALGVAEEAGELAHAVLKRLQGIRGFRDDVKYHAAVTDAIGDIAIYSMQLCSAIGVSFDSVVRHTADHVLQRDWKRFDESGKGNGK